MFELGVFGWTWVAASVFAASVVRGIAGFGFSLIVTVLATHVLPPATVIPAVLLWEISASIGHLPFVYKEVDWKSLAWLTLGMLFGSPHTLSRQTQRERILQNSGRKGGRTQKHHTRRSGSSHLGQRQTPIRIEIKSKINKKMFGHDNKKSYLCK